MIHLYAIAEGGSPPVEAPLASVSRAGLAGVFGPVPEDLEPTLERLRAHERVVEELMRGRALLPARFGSVLAGEDDLRKLLEERRGEFREALDRVRGRVELGVRASVDGPGDPSAASRLHARLEPAAAAASLPAMAAGGFAGSYLVDRDALRTFCERVDELRVEHPGVPIVLTGPWPPYSFTGSGSP